MKIKRSTIDKIIREEVSAVLKELYSTGESLLSFTGTNKTAKKEVEEYFNLNIEATQAQGIDFRKALEVAQSGASGLDEFKNKQEAANIVVNLCAQAKSFYNELIRYFDSIPGVQINEELSSHYRSVMNALAGAARTNPAISTMSTGGSGLIKIEKLQKEASEAYDILEQIFADIQSLSAEDYERGAEEEAGYERAHVARAQPKAMSENKRRRRK